MLQAPAVVQELDLLPPILPPAGVSVVKLGEAAARIVQGQRGRVDVGGVRGSASALVARAVADGGKRKVVLVAADPEGARRLADDVAAFGEREGVLVFVADETSPYAPVNPDRRAGMSRMATLASLATHRPWQVLVVSAASLARRVVPRAAVRAATRTASSRRTRLDRDWLVARLGETGYIRVPLVEDPGSFAVRGALLDVWPPNLTEPVRVELYGDLVVSIKPFDPLDQKSKKDVALPEVLLAPVREAMLAREYVARARDRVTQLTEAIDMPTLKAKALLDDVTSGRAFFGADAYLPAFYDRLESLFDYVGEDAVVMLDDPPARHRDAARGVASRVEEDADGHPQQRERRALPRRRRSSTTRPRSSSASAGAAWSRCIACTRPPGRPPRPRTSTPTSPHRARRSSSARSTTRTSVAP